MHAASACKCFTIKKKRLEKLVYANRALENTTHAQVQVEINRILQFRFKCKQAHINDQKVRLHNKNLSSPYLLVKQPSKSNTIIIITQNIKCDRTPKSLIQRPTYVIPEVSHLFTELPGIEIQQSFLVSRNTKAHHGDC